VILNTGFAGRWQVLGQDPLVICDTGHNEGGIREVVSQLAITPHKQLHFVIGLVNDKRLEPILEQLPLKGTYYFCKPNIPRGLNVDVLMKAAKDAGLRGKAYPSVKDAIAAAIGNADKNDLVFIGGSNFVVAEAI
jgi:dihydrofolate synthase/folylpolyglutamate synthase